MDKRERTQIKKDKTEQNKNKMTIWIQPESTKNKRYQNNR